MALFKEMHRRHSLARDGRMSDSQQMAPFSGPGWAMLIATLFWAGILLTMNTGGVWKLKAVFLRWFSDGWGYFCIWLKRCLKCVSRYLYWWEAKSKGRLSCSVAWCKLCREWGIDKKGKRLLWKEIETLFTGAKMKILITQNGSRTASLLASRSSRLPGGVVSCLLQTDAWGNPTA